MNNSRPCSSSALSFVPQYPKSPNEASQANSSSQSGLSGQQSLGTSIRRVNSTTTAAPRQVVEVHATVQSGAAWNPDPTRFSPGSETFFNEQNAPPLSWRTSASMVMSESPQPCAAESVSAATQARGRQNFYLHKHASTVIDFLESEVKRLDQLHSRKFRDLQLYEKTNLPEATKIPVIEKYNNSLQVLLKKKQIAKYAIDYVNGHDQKTKEDKLIAWNSSIIMGKYNECYPNDRIIDPSVCCYLTNTIICGVRNTLTNVYGPN